MLHPRRTKRGTCPDYFLSNQKRFTPMFRCSVEVLTIAMLIMLVIYQWNWNVMGHISSLYLARDIGLPDAMAVAVEPRLSGYIAVWLYSQKNKVT